MASTIIIGIGSTGLHMLEATQQAYYELTKKTKPDGNFVEFINLETDLNAIPRKVSSGDNSIKSLFLDLSDNNIAINNLKGQDGIDKDWIPPSREFKGNGAGGMSAYGRLSLWMNNNLRKFIELLKDANNNLGTGDKSVFIVGSLTGGTGSGLVLDIVYQVRQIIRSENVYGLFLLPSNSNSLEATQVKHENNFGALSAIDFYTSKNNEFNVKYPFGKLNVGANKPFKLLQLISPDYDGQNHGSLKGGLEELIKASGFQLCMHLMNIDKAGAPTFSSIIHERAIDGSGAAKTLKDYFTSSIKVVQYPKRQLRELLSIKYSTELLKSYISESKFLKKQEENTISKVDGILIPEIKIRLEKAIETSVERLSTKLKDSQSFLSELSNKSNTLISQRIHKVFTAKDLQHAEKSYYSAISTSSEDIFLDALIDEIYLICEDFHNKHENLPLINHVLSHVSNSLNEILVHYSNYGLKGTDDDYEFSIRKHLDLYFSSINQYKFLGLKADFIKEVFENMVRLASLNCAIPLINKIIIKLNDQNIDTPIIAKHSKRKLPTQTSIRTKINLINRVTETAKEDLNTPSLSNRHHVIMKNLTSESKTFIYLYSKENLEEEVQFGDRLYSNIDKKVRLSNLLATYPDNLWASINESTSVSDLYQHVLQNAVNYLEKINVFNDINVYDIVNEQKPRNATLRTLFDSKNEMDLQEELPAMVSIKRDDKFKFTNDDHSKLIVISNNINKLSNNLKYEVSNIRSNTLELNDLEDAVVFFKIYNYLGKDGDSPITFNPLIHIEYMEDVKKGLSRALNNSNYDISTRMPYLTLANFKPYLS